MDELALITVVATLIILIVALSKIKLIRDLFIIFIFVTIFFMVMVAIPAFQIEPIYSLLKQFYENLPEWINGLIEYFSRLLGDLGNMGG